MLFNIQRSVHINSPYQFNHNNSLQKAENIIRKIIHQFLVYLQNGVVVVVFHIIYILFAFPVIVFISPLSLFILLVEHYKLHGCDVYYRKSYYCCVQSHKNQKINTKYGLMSVSLDNNFLPPLLSLTLSFYTFH